MAILRRMIASFRQERIRYISLGSSIAVLTLGLVFLYTHSRAPSAATSSPVDSAAPAPAPSPQAIPPPAAIPEQLTPSEARFRLSSNAAPGDTDKYDSYSFYVHLLAQQEIYVEFKTGGIKVLLSFFTPAEETWGYCAGGTESAYLGQLVKGRTMAAAQGSFRFVASEEGSYLVTVKSSAAKGDIDVTFNYAVSDELPQSVGSEGLGLFRAAASP